MGRLKWRPFLPIKTIPCRKRFKWKCLLHSWLAYKTANGCSLQLRRFSKPNIASQGSDKRLAHFCRPNASVLRRQHEAIRASHAHFAASGSRTQGRPLQPFCCSTKGRSIQSRDSHKRSKLPDTSTFPRRAIARRSLIAVRKLDLESLRHLLQPQGRTLECHLQEYTCCSIQADLRQKGVQSADGDLYRSNKPGMDVLASRKKGTNLRVFKDMEVQFSLRTS